MIKKESRTEIRRNKHRKIRKRFTGTPERPRLYMATITYGRLMTMREIPGSASMKDVKAGLKTDNGFAWYMSPKSFEGISRSITEGGFIYHGKIKALADAEKPVQFVRRKIMKRSY